MHYNNYIIYDLEVFISKTIDQTIEKIFFQTYDNLILIGIFITINLQYLFNE